MYKQKQKQWNHISRFSKFTDQLVFKTRFPKVDLHTTNICLIHSTKHCKDTQLQSLELTLK